MKASPETVTKEDTLICWVDPYREGRTQAYDGNPILLNDKGVTLLYLCGYKSFTDTVPWEDVIAKVDMSQSRITVADGTFEGHFQVFEEL